jgi:hypothetical protein
VIKGWLEDGKLEWAGNNDLQVVRYTGLHPLPGYEQAFSIPEDKNKDGQPVGYFDHSFLNLITTKYKKKLNDWGFKAVSPSHFVFSQSQMRAVSPSHFVFSQSQ